MDLLREVVRHEVLLTVVHFTLLLSLGTLCTDIIRPALNLRRATLLLRDGGHQ